MVICLERGADLHTAQLMPLPRTVSCFSKIENGITFLVPADPGSPGQRAVKRVCVCVCDVVQSLLKAMETHSCVDVYYERRDQTFMLVLHNPFHPRTRHSLAEWRADLHSRVGFRCVLNNNNNNNNNRQTRQTRWQTSRRANLNPMARWSFVSLGRYSRQPISCFLR